MNMLRSTIFFFLLISIFWGSGCAGDQTNTEDETPLAPTAVREQTTGGDFHAKPADTRHDLPAYVYFLSTADALETPLTQNIINLIEAALKAKVAYVSTNHQLQLRDENDVIDKNQVHPDFPMLLYLNPRSNALREKPSELLELKISGTPGSPAYSTGASAKIATPIGTERRVVTNRIDICNLVGEMPCEGDAKRIAQNLFRVLLSTPFQ